MKYVVFKYKQLFMPVVFPDHVTHSQIKIEGAVPVSAGFLALDPEDHGKVRVLKGRSESLDLGPDLTQDPILLRRALNNYGTMFFLTEYYP